MKKNTARILEALDNYYGTDDRCSLDHENAWQLLIARRSRSGKLPERCSWGLK